MGDWRFGKACGKTWGWISNDSLSKLTRTGSVTAARRTLESVRSPQVGVARMQQDLQNLINPGGNTPSQIRQTYTPEPNGQKEKPLGVNRGASMLVGPE